MAPTTCPAKHGFTKMHACFKTGQEGAQGDEKRLIWGTTTKRGKITNENLHLLQSIVLNMINFFSQNSK